jgi:1-phosphofructokinase
VSGGDAHHRERIAVFSPSPLLTITVETGTDRPEVHLHAGGQGFWVARLAATLDTEVALCCALGGEPGVVLRALIGREGVELHAADAHTPNGVYVHDRRGGERVEIVRVASRSLARHAADELYGVALAAGLDADATLLTGTQPRGVVDDDLYARLALDLRANGKRVLADLTGSTLEATLDSGLDLLRVSDEEMVRYGYARSDDASDLLDGARRLQAAGARTVVVSRDDAPTLLVRADGAPPLQVVAPRFGTLDPRGTGDSMFAAIGTALSRGRDTVDAVRLGVAAGALNATRRGLGTGTREEIEHLAGHVRAGRVGAEACDAP